MVSRGFGGFAVAAWAVPVVSIIVSAIIIVPVMLVRERFIIYLQLV
jgi:hypothetical protein